MKYDPGKHHRHSIRLKGYDYSRPGAYFVTICVKNRECLFGEIRNGKMMLNDFGRIIDYHWQRIPSHFQNAQLDEFVVMPDHFHGILWLVDDSGNMATNPGGAKHSGQPIFSKQDDVARNASPPHHPHPPTPPNRPKGTQPGSLSAIIQNFTSITSRKINRIRKTPGAKLWQRNYHEHIIRNERALANIRQYIINNPQKWKLDRKHSQNQKQ